MGKEILWDKITWGENDDYVAFAFGDFDSKAMGIIRTSSSNRYSHDLSAPTKDITAEIPGGDGQYYFGTTYNPKQFVVDFAFEGLTKRQLRAMKAAFAGKELRELCFAEASNRIYMAKVTGQPNIKALCFGNGSEEVLKGEGSIQFTAYWPYAREKYPVVYTNEGKGIPYIENEGDIPAHFVLSCEGAVTSENETMEIKVGDLSIKIGEAYDLKWDSRTGIVSAKFSIDGNQVEKAIEYEGNSLGGIPVGGSNVCKIPDGATLTYYQWYY